MSVSEPKSGASTNFATSARPVYNRMRPISGRPENPQAVNSGVRRHTAVSRVPTLSPQQVLQEFSFMQPASLRMMARILTEEEARSKAEEQFWPKVNLPEDRGDCWNWTAATRGGYGNLKVLGINVRAHRLSYALAHGVMPGNLLVCHHCDNPLCVNPHHLFLGTDADNSRDKCAKGRNHNPDSRGTKNGNAKINDEQLEEIRARIAAGETNVSIAKDYPISHSMVSRIRVGSSYKPL